MGLQARFVLCLCVLVAVHLQIGLFYEIPDVKIEVLKPKGVRVSIPDSENVTSFAFHGNINKPIEQTDVGKIGGEVILPNRTESKWRIEFPEEKLIEGDVIRYYVFVSVDGIGYIKDGLTYVVGGGPTPTEATIVPAVTVAGPATVNPCKPSLTFVRDKAVCKGDVIFEDDFSKPLSDSAWLVEHHIPQEHLEHPFISYQRNAVSVENGHLRIHPDLQQNMPGFNYESTYLDLNDACTGSICEQRTDGANIIPPVVTGRIRSRVSFKYGRIDIRAKLPQGDWLYPEILLEPLYKRYGTTGYASGLIKIAKARGNKELAATIHYDEIQYGNSVLEGGIVVSEQCANRLKYRKEKPAGINWGDDYHTYSVLWTPDSITFVVDEEVVREFSPPNGGIAKLLTHGCEDLSKGYKTKIAPFDDEFFIVLGVAAGGRTEFPDTNDKPWRNRELKAKLNFRKAQETWFPTWTGTSDMLVDYVRVTAL